MARLDTRLCYLCALIEMLCKATDNRHCDIADCIGERGMSDLYVHQDAFRTLLFDDVIEIIADKYQITRGRHKVPYRSIYDRDTFDNGQIFQRLIHEAARKGETGSTAYAVYKSWISDCIADKDERFLSFTPMYIYACYKAGEILDNESAEKAIEASKLKKK